jgi:iron complex outermembrane receptor protein
VRSLKSAALGILLMSAASGADAHKPARDLTESSLEDLMNIEVTTVSKKEQKLQQAPAAVFVITQEDIRRSGMISLPDLLRMAPGVQSGQVQGGEWAVSARGFNNSYSNKLLVLVDGRTVYSPINSGVFWDEQDLLLSNIERIEVIRGPGATLWGANAVNGVINIITKSARDTQGVLATAGVGSEGQGLGGLRVGGRLGDNGYYRFSTKYLHGRDLFSSDGQRNISAQSSIASGVRADWTLSGRDSLTVKGDLFHGNAESAADTTKAVFAGRDATIARTAGGSLTANWTRRQSGRSQTELRVYFSHAERNEAIYRVSYSTIDVDFLHELTLSESNSLVWGLGFRQSPLRSSGTDYIALSPPARNDALFSGFVQDQWAVVPDRLALILGTKIEHNNFTGVEVQPGARLLWTPGSRHTLWAAASRAIRAPSMLEFNLRAQPGDLTGPNGIPIHVESLGSPSFRSEDMLAYELGYRLQAWKRFSVDLAGHHNIYTHLKTYEPGAPAFELAPQPHLNILTRFGNLMRGETHGVEIASNWNVAGRWRLIPSYSWLQLNMRVDANSLDTTSTGIERQSPRHQYQFRSNLDISRALQFDAAAYYTSSLPNLAVPAYTRLDARLGYRPRQDLEINLSGQNLQGGRHAEFISDGPYPRVTIGRSVMVTLTWGF